MRNSAGVGVRITGGGDGETEYGGMEIVAYKPFHDNLKSHSFLIHRIPMDGSTSQQRTRE